MDASIIQMTAIVNRVRLIPGQVWSLLIISAILLVMWSVVVPIFEAPDEPLHWSVARYIHDHGRLPFYSPALVEANQAPLYYLLIAPISAKMDRREARVWIDSGQLRVPCPPRFYQDCRLDFKKFWPIRWARFLTAGFSLLTIFFTYLAGYEATGRQDTGLLAGALVAFLPQFTFRGTNVSNDALVATTSAAATFYILRLIRQGFSWKSGLFASISVALAFLSKVSAIIFLPVLAGALLSGQGQWILKLKRLSMMLVALTCVTPWLIRNQILYGDPLGSKAMLTVVSDLVHTKSISSPYFWNPFPRMLAESFVGVFGWMSLYLPAWIYAVFAILGLIAVAGFIRSIFRHMIDMRLALVLTALPLLAIASVVQLNLTFSQPQGRYLFPALTASMTLLALGLEAIPFWNRTCMCVTIAVLAGINIYVLFGVEFRAYWLPLHSINSTIVDTSVNSIVGSGAPGPPLRPGSRFGQTFRPHSSNLNAVVIQVATYREKIPSGVVNLHLRRSPQDNTDLASVSLPASKLTDWGSVELSFPPLSDSKDKSYYFFVDTHNIPAAYPVTVFVSNKDVYSGGQFFENSEGTPYDMSFQLIDSVVCDACGPSQK